jgi:hypothetical protein
MQTCCFLCGITLQPYTIDELLSIAVNYKNQQTKQSNQHAHYKQHKSPALHINPTINNKISNRIIWIDYNMDWLADCILITSAGYYKYEYNGKPKNGIFAHSDCLKFIQKNNKIELTYEHIKNITSNKKNAKYTACDLDYGLIHKYWGSEFNFKKMCIDGNHKLCESPLKSKKTAAHVQRIFKQIDKLKQRQTT